MTERDGKSEKPVSVAQIAADDRLLDALGRGEAAEADLAGDPAAAMLAAWRADLDDDSDSWGEAWNDDPMLVDAVLNDPALDDPALDDPDSDDPAWDDRMRDDQMLHDPAPDVPPPAGDPRRKRRLVQAILGAAAAAVFAVGLAVSAHQAQPGSVLWPVSKVVYPQRSEVKAAEKAIADARAAVAAGQTAEALALLVTAEEHITRIADPGTAARLRAEVEALRLMLGPPQATPPVPPTATAPPVAEPTPSPAPRPSGDPSAPSGGGDGEQQDPRPAPSTSSPGGILPGLPLPTPLLPLPSLPLPTLPPLPPILG